MKLAYKIPHRVTCRMVGGQFIATCSCKAWSRAVDPQFFSRLPIAFNVGSQSQLVGDTIEAGHKHASSHVLEQSETARSWARRRAPEQTT